MADTPLKKDAGETLGNVQQLFQQVQEQAKSGEIDQGLLDQVASALQMSVEQVSTPSHSAPSASADASMPSSAASSSGSSSSSSMPSSVAKEAPSVPSAPSSSAASLPSSSVPSSGAVESKPSMSKGEGTELPSVPAAAAPPRSNLLLNRAGDQIEQDLPEFINLLQNGSRRAMAKARDVAGDQERFDEMFKTAQHAILTEIGFTHTNLRKIHNGAPEEFNLAKAISASDAPGYYLMPLVRLMLPVYAGLVRRTNADTPKTGSDRATWRAQLGFQNVNNSTNFHTAEGEIGDEINETPIQFQTPYMDISNNDKVTLKATAAARGYDDPLQISIIRSLTLGLQTQERRLLGDNAAEIIRPASVTVTPAGAGALGNNDDTFMVTALTYHGRLSNSHGVATVGGPVGETNARESAGANLSANGTAVVAWPAVPGAIAYNVYYVPHGVDANSVYLKTVTVTSVVISSVSGVASVTPASNTTSAALGYEGYLAWCEKSTIYSNSIYGKIANEDFLGGPLVTNGSGIGVFDKLLAELWTTWQISPTAIVCSPQAAAHYTSKVMTLNQPQYRVDITNKQGQLTGGVYVTTYTNKFAPYGDGNFREIDIIPSPYMYDGTYLFLSESIPYAMARESRGFARDVLIPWTYFPLAQTKINYPFAVTTSEVLECFHPSVQTAVVGVDVSSS